jgi:CBS domain-containing protein
MATVKDILDRKGATVVTIVPDDSVLTAAKLMNQMRIGGVIVVEDDDIVGIFTERDVLRRVVAERLDPATTQDGLCGIVTSGDLLAHQAEEQADTIQYLNSYMFDIRT